MLCLPGHCHGKHHCRFRRFISLYKRLKWKSVDGKGFEANVGRRGAQRPKSLKRVWVFQPGG